MPAGAWTGAGNPVRLTDPEGADVYAYDALDRLTKATREDTAGLTVSVEEYAFSALGALKVNAGVPYYELDLAGSVRRLRTPGGGDVGGYRYSAFGATLENTVAP